MNSVQEKSDSGHRKWMWPFELIEQIGEGGMGIVYRAKYVVNGREVALKMLPKDVTDETALARFERELEVLKTLKHPNIVRCFGGSCENNRRFYAMELVHGGTLEDKLEERSKLPWEQVIYYALQICDALECSHAKGVVHRDVKPANFLITKAGLLKLSDFGLASVAAARKITAAGKTAGTFLYMAPEQIHGHKVSPQTDLYALGCVLYELITGVPPFVGETPAATLHMHCRDKPVRPTEKTLDCPLELERIILQLLEKKEEDRFESAIEVAKRLKGIKRTVTVLTKNRLSQLERTASNIAASPNERILKPSEELQASQAFAFPTWVTITLIILLCCSVAWNLTNVSTQRASTSAEELWIAAASSSQLPIRLQAIESVGEIARVSGQHLDILKAGLQDKESQVREASALAIQHVGGNAKELTPALIAVTKHDPDVQVREAARKAAEVLKSTKVNDAFPWFGATLATLLILITSAGIFFWFKYPNARVGMLRQN